MGTRSRMKSSVNPKLPLALRFGCVCIVAAALAALPDEVRAQGALVNGDNHAGTIAIPGQLHEWTFTAAQGDYVAVSIGWVSGTLSPWIRLISPVGAELGNEFGSTTAQQIHLSAPSSGTYRVIVGSRSGAGNITGTGGYLLRLARVPGAFVVPEDDEGGLLTNGENHAGRIELGDLDPWTFTAVAGDFVTLSIGRADGSLYPWIRLISPSGELLGNASGSTTVAQITLTIPSTGTYTVVVGSRSGAGNITGTGGYLLRLARVPGAFVVPEDDEGGPLTNGENHAGRIELGDLDLWTFTAVAGDFVTLSIGRADGSLFPWIRLISPSGELLGNASGSTTVAQITLTIPSTGTYTVVVGSRSGAGNITGTGGYLLRLARVPGAFVVPEDDEGGPLTNGENHAGRIELGDLDLWTFTASGGDAVTVTIGRTAGSLYPWIRLISPEGQVLGNAFGSTTAQQITRTLAAAGTYTVLVGSRSGAGNITGTGNYAVSVISIGTGCVPEVAPATASAPAAGIQGTISVTAGPGCDWAAQSTAAWITVTAGSFGTGNGNVAYTVAANTTGAERTGLLTIAGHTVTINQDADDCTFGVTPTAVDVSAGGATTKAVVTTSGTACTWTAESDVDWIAIIGSPSGTGSGTVSLDIHPNPTTEASSGTVAIAGHTLTITRDGATFAYPLSEGATGPFFDMDIALANPNPVPAPATLIFLRPATDGGSAQPPIIQTLTLAPRSRQTIRVNDISGLAGTAVSTVVESDAELPIIVERTMYWDREHRYEGHTEIAPERPAERWYFAEGSQGFFDTYVLLGNGSPDTAIVTVTFLRETGPPVVRTYHVAPDSRATVYVGLIPELVHSSFSIVVDSTIPIVAERAMYFGVARPWDGGHGSAGATALSTSWFHAEGATGPLFDTFILVGNPNAVAANVTFTWLCLDGTVVTRTKTIAPNARLTVNVETEDPQLADNAMSTTVTSDVPIVSERAMYWPAVWSSAHNSFGLTSVGTRWGLAEGKVGLEQDFHTYILLSNGNEEEAIVTVTFLRAAGPPVAKSFTVPPTSRFNVHVNSMVPELQHEEFGAVVEVVNGQSIAVERAMYWSALGQVWAGGTNAAAVRLP